MDQLTHWWPTIVTGAIVIGTAYVADSSIKRHEETLKTLVAKVQQLEKDVVVLETLAGVKKG